ncbi:hypothetical protein [Gordonia terrae]|uniref:hypothetical protein n=1 Tax=Gordonia terrae TaxID=2055 RepID=UPI003F6B6FE5
MKARTLVEHLAFIDGGQDDYGNVIEQWADPVERRCYGFNFPDSTEPLAEGHNRLVVDRVMLVPRSWVDQVGSKDRFRIPGESPTGWPVYEVQGVPGSGKYNPLRWHPGGVVLLQRVDG